MYYRIQLNKIATVFACLALVILTAMAGFAQETTAGLQGTVKDPQGATIPKASITVTSSAMIGAKKAETDAGGYFRFANLPPGAYVVTVTASGFRTYKQELALSVGHLPSLEIAMAVGAVSETVEVTEGASQIDVSQSKVQTNISNTVLNSVPTGRSFQSVIQFAPGARSEPLQNSTGSANNGFQVDGASNAENSYLVEGMETASLQDGHSAANVPMDFIQEIQIKTSGFEAEFGGALGGVINVVQKRGSNEIHGSVFGYYAGDRFNSAPNPTLIKNPSIAANANGAKLLDQPAENYQPKKDHYRTITPGFSVGGPLMKDRLWAFFSIAPEYATIARTVNFAPTAPVPGNSAIHQDTNTYYALGRLDYLATQKIRVFGSWSYAYNRVQGVATLPQADDAFGQFNASSTNNLNNYNYGQGSVNPNVIYSVGADITITPNLIATTRFGYFFQDTQSRGIPTGIQYTYRDTNYSYSTTNSPALASTKALDGSLLPAAYVNSTGWTNIGANTSTSKDQWQRYNFGQDMAYFKHGFGGTHNLKFGYSLTHGTNDVATGYNTADVYVSYVNAYAPNTTDGQSRCKAINATNLKNYGTIGGGSADGTACTGLWGTVNIRDLGTAGKVGGFNHGLYFQDSFTVSKRLTLNMGVRMEKESLPSYNSLPGFNGIDFGWGQKVAPRLGGAYDVTGTGKFKVYASFGYFFDVMKYGLPRGSFGGDYWHDCVYALDTPNFNLIQPSRDAQGHYCPLGGGATPAVGSLPSQMRFIENYDYREPANDPNQPGSLGAGGLVDPNLKPIKQHEVSIGAAWQISPSLVFEPRYNRKRLDRTIEDAGTITQNGEVYYIVNPGQGVNATVPNCNGCPANPPAIRNYDGLELRLTKRAGKFYGSFSYTYSRLYGNYAGSTDTDLSDSLGRNTSNTGRAFDEPFMSFDAHGKPASGLLATDRPNTIKMYGYYDLKSKAGTTRIGGYQQIYSGTPLSSYISVWGAPVFVEGRGNFADVTRNPTTGAWALGNVGTKRTPMYNQTDLNISHEVHVSKSNEKMLARLSVDCFNCLNNHSATLINQNLIRTSGINPATCGTAGTNCTKIGADAAGFDYGAIMSKGYDWIAAANTQGRTLNSLYGQPYGWQPRRSLRMEFKFIF